MFQSRNRETYDSNSSTSREIETSTLFQFQSRNRETYDSNSKMSKDLGTLFSLYVSIS